LISKISIQCPNTYEKPLPYFRGCDYFEDIGIDGKTILGIQLDLTEKRTSRCGSYL
jgi:hypothetical protein